MSASTFLTLGLGDVTSPDTIARLFILLEAGSGYIFLALIITYMPVLEQAYGAREIDNMLIHSRAGRPPSAIKLLHRYSGTDRAEILRGNLREAERWMAKVLQSHLSHPVLTFYRPHHWGHSWLDVGVVRSPLGVAEAGAVWLTQGELVVTRPGGAVAAFCRTARPRVGGRDHARRLRADRPRRQPLRRLYGGALGHRRH